MLQTLQETAAAHDRFFPLSLGAQGSCMIGGNLSTNAGGTAALAYGVGKKLNEKVIIYDLGGGTFDVSVIEIRGQVFEVKATGGDIFLGGIDFDNAMIAYVLADFRRRHDVDLSGDPVAMQRIKDLADRHAKGRIVSCLEGGYNLGALARSVASHLRVLAEV